MKHKILAIATTAWFTTAVSASDVADFFGDLNTFSGNFSQTVVQDGQLVQQSVGQVKLKKPLKFRWDYQTPERMQLISDGNRFYHYDMDLAQATSKPIEEVSETAIAALLNDKNKIDETFTVHSLGSQSLEKQFPNQANEWLQKASLFYELTPNEQGGDMQATRVILGLTINRKLTVFYAEDAYGQNTFLFDNVSQNAAIGDNQFIFNPPVGVDVLGE